MLWSNCSLPVRLMSRSCSAARCISVQGGRQAFPSGSQPLENAEWGLVSLSLFAVGRLRSDVHVHVRVWHVRVCFQPHLMPVGSLDLAHNIQCLSLCRKECCGHLLLHSPRSASEVCYSPHSCCCYCRCRYCFHFLSVGGCDCDCDCDSESEHDGAHEPSSSQQNDASEFARHDRGLLTYTPAIAVHQHNINKRTK